MKPDERSAAMLEILLSLKLCPKCGGRGWLEIPAAGTPGGIETPECGCRKEARERFAKFRLRRTFRY